MNSFNTASVLISLAAILPVIVAKAGLHWIGLGGAGETIQQVYIKMAKMFMTQSVMK